MTVEAATFISNLNSALPAATDAKAEGDDHIRLVKQILLAQFPNFTATAVTATCAQLNSAATGSFTTITATGSITITGAALLGYDTGSGGTVTQSTSKSNSVTLNKPCGKITMNNAALSSGATVIFTFFNSLIGSTDMIDVQLDAAGISSTADYNVWASVGAGAAVVALKNISAGSLSESVGLRFAVKKVAQS